MNSRTALALWVIVQPQQAPVTVNTKLPLHQPARTQSQQPVAQNIIHPSQVVQQVPDPMDQSNIIYHSHGKVNLTPSFSHWKAFRTLSNSFSGWDPVRIAVKPFRHITRNILQTSLLMTVISNNPPEALLIRIMPTLDIMFITSTNT